jgi:quercetin dioxygenase-like cupin family protein
MKRSQQCHKCNHFTKSRNNGDKASLFVCIDWEYTLPAIKIPIIMKTLLKSGLLFAFSFWLSGCYQSGTSQDNTDTDQSLAVSNDMIDMPAYDPAMDMTIMAADAVEMLGDTLGIKMYIATMAPGDSVGWHDHPDYTIYILEGGTMAVYRNGSDERQIIELPAGAGFVAPAASDAAVNVGNTTIRMLTHDIYRPRGDGGVKIHVSQ